MWKVDHIFEKKYCICFTLHNLLYCFYIYLNMNLSQFRLNKYINYWHVRMISQLYLTVCWLQGSILYILTGA
jgi:hypothetical protein